MAVSLSTRASVIFVSELLQEIRVPPPIAPTPPPPPPQFVDEIFLLSTSPVLISKSPSKEAKEEEELAEDRDMESKDLSEPQQSSAFPPNLSS